MPFPSNPEKILSLPDAMALVRTYASEVRPRATETLPLLDAVGRSLAAEVLADRDQPPFDRATRDGFAVRAADLAIDALRVMGTVKAGETWQDSSLAAGEAIEVMTGAPVPVGADAVVMIEHVAEANGTIRLEAGRTMATGMNIVPRGSEAHAGDTVLPAGILLGAAEIALAASCGAAQVQVYSRPRVAILATGDELVEVEQSPLSHQIRNSNGYALAALVADAGGEPVRLQISRDDRADLERNLSAAMECELIVLSGGVSMGKYDLVEEVLSSFGAEFFFTGVRMQPGRPAVFGRLSNGPYFFGLPGNPVSTEVTFRCLTAPLLRTMSGSTEPGPQFASATLAHDEPGKPELHRLLPARLTAGLASAEVSLVRWQGSGDMNANARANCYAVLPPEQKQFKTGDIVRVLLR